MVNIMEDKVYSNKNRISLVGLLFLLIGLSGITILIFVAEPTAAGYIIIIAFGFIGVATSTLAIMQISDRRKKKSDEE
jgi:hypothetical protein